MKYPLGKIIAFDLHDETSANAAIQVAADAELDGTTTEVVVKVVSSSAQDKAAGSGMLTAYLVGLSTILSTSSPWYGKSVPVIEQITMNGTDAVTTSNKFSRLFMLFWATGAVPAGNITVTNVAGAITYLTMAAGALFSNGAKLWIPSGAQCMFLGSQSFMKTRTAITDAIEIQTTFNSFTDSDTGEFIAKSFMGTKDSGEYIPGDLTPKLASSGAYLSFVHAIIGNASSYNSRLIFGVVPA